MPVSAIWFIWLSKATSHFADIDELLVLNLIANPDVFLPKFQTAGRDCSFRNIGSRSYSVSVSVNILPISFRLDASVYFI